MKGFIGKTAVDENQLFAIFNFWGDFEFCRAKCVSVCVSGGGRIDNVASIVGSCALANIFQLGAIKHCVKRGSILRGVYYPQIFLGNKFRRGLSPGVPVLNGVKNCFTDFWIAKVLSVIWCQPRAIGGN